VGSKVVLRTQRQVPNRQERATGLESAGDALTDDAIEIAGKFPFALKFDGSDDRGVARQA
jgi:hypothetical protein